MRDIFKSDKFRVPAASDRTWPDRDQFLRSQKLYRQRVKDALNSNAMREILPFIDWEKLIKQNDVWMNQDSGGAKFLVALMSFHRFHLALES